MSGCGVSTLLILRISIKKIRFLAILEATVYSETPETSNACALTLLHSERPTLYTILAFLSATGLKEVTLIEKRGKK